MTPDVVKAEYRGDFKIELFFEDGANGIVDFERYGAKGGVFEKFKDEKFFRNFKINEKLGILNWGDEIDIAPETLYSQATGTPLPDWMETNAGLAAD